MQAVTDVNKRPATARIAIVGKTISPSSRETHAAGE